MDPTEEKKLLDGGNFIRDPDTGAYLQHLQGQFLRIKDGKTFWMDVVTIHGAEGLNADNITEQNTEGIKTKNSPVKMSGSTKKPKATWSRDQTLSLIAFYKKYSNDFASGKMKNDVIWNKFKVEQSGQEGCHDLPQIKDKWAALKKQFYTKLDNTSGKATGSAPVKFEFYDEMYELLRDNPIAVASSSRGIENMPRKKLEKKRESDTLDDDSNHEDIVEEVEVMPKPKKTKFETYLAKLTQDQKKKEEVAEQRQNEAMARQDTYLKIFKDFTAVMKDSFTQKKT